MFRYKGVTFVENRDTARLYNCGPVTRQVGVTSPILWGDGSPDPDTTAVDNIWYVGQGSTGVTHYIQCDDLGTSAFVRGDRVTIHTARTSAYGVTNGVNPFDGETYEAIVNSVDEATERLTLTQPMTQEYRQSFTATPTSTAVGVFYAFITKGRSIHPIYVIGARGIHTFAARQGIKVYNPEDNQADLPGVVRVTWDEYGQFNRWNPYVYEVLYAVASDTVSGYAQAALR
jgi:hypothetical protein